MCSMWVVAIATDESAVGGKVKFHSMFKYIYLTWRVIFLLNSMWRKKVNIIYVWNEVKRFAIVEVQLRVRYWYLKKRRIKKSRCIIFGRSNNTILFSKSTCSAYLISNSGFVRPFFFWTMKVLNKKVKVHEKLSLKVIIIEGKSWKRFAIAKLTFGM